ncbi:Fungal specific transcription factor domain-containing protein [Tolypocladium paradoxum]|uniref:Fungal specific transcription factor domain-containing protein n=1 Tax=Tolypocladium paradoxum TaxID=94208 RepID=A0A2S4KQP4_9HYPO|nr:Fungal specific transcription factor domain-containing protein [Tolypocladium paradoxum]
MPIFAPTSLRNERSDVHFDTVHVASGTNTHNHNTSPHYLDAPLNQATQPLLNASTGIETTEPRPSVSAEGVLQCANPQVLESPSSFQANSTLSAKSSGSQQLSVQASCFGDTGYMQILSRDNVLDEDKILTHQANLETISSALQEGFLESYFEYCFVWCPVLDRDFLQNPSSGLDESPLLQQALALCGNRINPPLIQYRDSAVYYNRAKELFYSNYESNALVRLASIMLFFWWSAGAPNLLNMDNAWWWTGIAIRIAQECGLHREPQPHQLAQDGKTAGLRRRIWWTLFARDRILSISQGRPTIIDPDYCDARMVTAEDFPDPSDPKVEIFINWVKLLDISGRISKHLSKRVEDRTDTANFSHDLTSWVQSLPEALSLPIRTARTMAFNRDVHRLFLTYLTNITLLHLSKSSQLLPKASKAAIVAASCVARLFEDFLTRGNIRFLSGDAGWEIAVAILALLHARRIEDLRPYADADIQTLRTALRQMTLLWPSSRMFYAAFDKLLGIDQTSVNRHNPIVRAEGDQVEDAEILDPIGGDADWMDSFPFVTEQTSPLINAVLVRSPAMAFSGLHWPLDFNAGLQEFLSQPDDYSFDMFNL